MDETYVGGAEEGVRGRQTGTKVLVAIAVETPADGSRIGGIRMRVVADASARSLLDFVREAVEPGTTVHTDGWSSYSQLEDLGYPHEVTVLRDPRLATQLLPHVHRIASWFKRWWAGTHQGAISARHLDYYLDEFSFNSEIGITASALTAGARATEANSSTGWSSRRWPLSRYPTGR